MKKLFIAALAAVVMFGCKSIQNAVHPHDTYAKRMFYEKYLNPADPNDARIIQTLAAVRANPQSAALHNDLGQLLRQKGFPKDAEAEFERAVDADSSFYPAWYNLGLVREGRGNYPGARFAFGRTIHYKPGHSAALFQLGLMEEERKNTDAAIDYYAKAIGINHALLDVRVNPRIIDSKLIDLALLRLYPTEHAREAIQFQNAAEPMYLPPATTTAAPSPQPQPKDILPPGPPATSPAAQTPPPTPPVRPPV